MNSLDKRYAPEFWIAEGFDREIYELYGDNATLSLREIFEHTDISSSDKIWCATQRGVLTRSEMNAALEIVATRAINNAKSLGIDCCTRNEWATKWLSGEDIAWESAAARAVAAAAAYAAAVAYTAACAETVQQIRDIINVCDGGENE